jgi:hypothetical protein
MVSPRRLRVCFQFRHPGLFAICSGISAHQMVRFVERTTRAISRTRLGLDDSFSYKLTTFVGNERSAQIVQRYEAGETITSLAAVLAFHRCTIHEHLNRHGVNRSAAQPKLTPKHIPPAAELYREGL